MSSVVPNDGQDIPSLLSPLGPVTQSPLAYALILVALYWIVKLIRPSDVGRPPRVSYWIPWVGSALEMGEDPDGFFKNMTKLLGPVFRVKALGQEMIYVTSPQLISAIHRDPQKFDFISIRLDMSSKIFALRESILSQPYMVDTFMPEHHQLFLPTHLKPMLQVYLNSIHDILLGMITSMDGASGPLKTFVIPPAYRAASLAAFGNGFPVEETYPHFKTFDENFHLLGANVPRILLSKTTKAWDNLINIIEFYVKGLVNSGEELSSLVMVALNGLEHGDWSYRDVATILATQLWTLQANAIFASYWLIALQLREAEGLAPLVAELDAVREEWLATHPSASLGPAFFDQVTSSSNSLPLLSSAIQETLRFSTSTFSIRQVAAPAELGGYKLRVGEKVICATRSVHMDDEIHPHPERFDIRRYLQTLRATKDGRAVPNHSMPFGGGVSKCEGRHFAMTELRLFIAIILTYGTIEIDEGCTTAPEFMRERMGLGVMHPKGDLDVILRKRKL